MCHYRERRGYQLRLGPETATLRCCVAIDPFSVNAAGDKAIGHFSMAPRGLLCWLEGSTTNESSGCLPLTHMNDPDIQEARNYHPIQMRFKLLRNAEQ
jgi:hypothetical protein